MKVGWFATVARVSCEEGSCGRKDIRFKPGLRRAKAIFLGLAMFTKPLHSPNKPLTSVDYDFIKRSGTGPGRQAKEANMHAQLLDGIANVKSRDDGTVHTIHLAGDAKATVAEVCVGKKFTRLNFAKAVDADMLPEGIVLGGRSKSWVGGGIRVNADNLDACRTLLLAVVGNVDEPEAEVEAEAPAADPRDEDAGLPAGAHEAAETVVAPAPRRRRSRK